MRSPAEAVALSSPGQTLAELPHGARVLVIRLRSMGDVILTTPALRLLHEWRPDLRVSVLVERPWNELLEGNPAVDSIIALNGKLNTAWQVWRKRFAATVNLHGGPTSAFLTRCSRAGLRAGWAHFRSPSVYTAHIPTAQEILGRSGPVHTAEHVASAFFWLGVPFSEPPRAQVFPQEDARDSVAARLRAMGAGAGEEYAVIHPTALYDTKRWSAEGFADISRYLERTYGLRSIYICGATEGRALDAVEKHRSRRLLRAAGWHLREVIALMAGARIFIGNDSGPAHIAAASGIPVLTIFGSSHSALWRPWKAVDSAVVQNYFDCNPCAGDRCYAYTEPRCILSITTEQVRVCVDALLNPR